MMIRNYSRKDVLKRREIQVVVLSVFKDEIIFNCRIDQSPVSNGDGAEELFFASHESINQNIWPEGICFEDWHTQRKVPMTQYLSFVEGERPPFDGSEKGEFFDVKRFQLNSQEPFPEPGDLAHVYGEQFQLTMCKYFYVVYVKEFYHTVYAPSGSGDSWSTLYTKCRICRCENIHYTV